MRLEFEGVPAKHPYRGVTTRRRDFAQMTVVLYEFDPNASFPLHHHPEEQLVVMLDGTCNFTVGDQMLHLSEGESTLAPPGVPHGCHAGPMGCLFLNILAPKRVGEGQINLVKA